MDIHAPDHPILSWKQFFVHLVVVTCGILIALGLEGVHEAVHFHYLVRDTRESVRSEMSRNLDYCKMEADRVTADSKKLKALAADAPGLASSDPGQIQMRLKAIDNPGYFFLANSWQTALSTGALEHMSTEEVNAYGVTAESIKIYSGLQRDAESQEAITKSFFEAHPHLTPEQAEEGTEQLLLFSRAEGTLAYVVPQLQESIEKSLRAAGDK